MRDIDMLEYIKNTVRLITLREKKEIFTQGSRLKQEEYEKKLDEFIRQRNIIENIESNIIHEIDTMEKLIKE